ncbi:MAG: vWA domain-containing protein [Thermoguttaceae bacterium]
MLPEFSNMLSWWQWAILAAVPPAIVLLYFLKLKRRPLEVPSTYLWHKSVEDLHVNSIWQRLRNNLVLYLQLAVVLFIVLAVLRPSWNALHLSGSRLVLLIDNSASMQANDVKPTRLDEAKRRVGELIDQMRSGDAALLISFSDTARVEQNFTDNRQQLREALAAIHPSQHSTNISEALKLAAGLVNPGQANEKSTDLRVAGTKLFIFSDGRFPPVQNFELGNLEPTFVPIGHSDAVNVGIVAFGVSRADEKNGKLQAFARLGNFGPATAEVLLKLFLNDQIRATDADRLSIPPGETRGLAFDLPDFDSGVLHLQAETGDQLAVDDQAWTIVNPPRRARVLLITPKNERLEQVLATKAATELAEVRVETPAFLKSKSYQEQVELGVWDLVIYDRAAPAKMPRTNTFLIGCLPPGTGWKAKPEVTLPQIIDAAVSHRLMQWVDINEIQKVIAATPLVVPSGGTVLIDSDAGPLLAIAPREGFEDLVLGMVLVEERSAADGSRAVYRNTDWPWRVSFASFVFNLLTDRAGGQDLTASSSYRPGMPVTFEAPDSRTGLDVQVPSGATLRLPPSSSGKLTFTATDELGVYRILSGGKLVQQFAVNLLDPAESNIRPPADPAIKIGYVDVAGKTGWVAGHREIWRELILAGLAIALLEWLIYLRRVYI